MPTDHSSPPRPALAARRARVGIGSPAWATTTPVAGSSWAPCSRRVQITNPGNPWSLINKFEPAPISCSCWPSAWAQCSSS